jgi:hypothetical protein
LSRGTVSVSFDSLIVVRRGSSVGNKLMKQRLLDQWVPRFDGDHSLASGASDCGWEDPELKIMLPLIAKAPLPPGGGFRCIYAEESPIVFCIVL